jgi:hypothetical protein
MSGVISKRVSVILLAGIFLLQGIPRVVRSQSLPNFVQDDFTHRISLYDVNGHPLGSDAIETKGSPYFAIKWKLGWLRLADGRFFQGVPLKLDLQKQVAHYRRADGNDIELEPGQVSDLAMLDTVGGATVVYRFVCGLQPIDNQTMTSFYLLLDSGKVSILESMQKVFKEDKDNFSGETLREYRLNNEFYILSGGKLSRIKRDAKFFVALTQDKHGQMDDYQQKTKGSFRSIEDIRRFINYYNGLP